MPWYGAFAGGAIAGCNRRGLVVTHFDRLDVPVLAVNCAALRCVRDTQVRYCHLFYSRPL